MSVFDNTPAENETPPAPDAKPAQNAKTEPEGSASQPSSSNSNKSKGVTGLLREIFNRNASQPNFEEDEANSNGSFLEGNLSQTTNPSEKETSNPPFFPDDDPLKPDPSETPAAGSLAFPAKDDIGDQSITISPEGVSQDETTIPNKGGLKSIFTGVLRNAGAQGPQSDGKQEKEIDERLSSILSTNTEEPADLTWEDKFLASLGPTKEQNQELFDSGKGFFDPASNFLSDIKSKDDDEVDYLFQEWTGFNKSSKDNQESPPQKPIFSPELDEPDSIKQLPSKSIFDDDEDALFEENHKNFKDKNSFLYTPSQDQGTVSLEEMRQVVLENIQNEHSEPKQRKKHTSVDMSSRSIQHLNRFEIIALAFLGVVIVAVAIAIVFILTRTTTPKNAPTKIAPTAIIRDIAPSPVGVRMTGGWFFQLNKNTIVDGHWKPKGPEWLEGSDIRRVVTLPWNKQLEAAIKTILPGDEIVLSFNNNEQIAYLVDQIKQVAADQTNAGDQTVPSLLIILYDENSPDRWIITCLPNTK